MNKREFEEKIKKLNIKKVQPKGLIKSFLERKRDYYINKNELNIYGLYKKDREFVIFFKDIERGIITELGHFNTDEEAYDNLLNTIISWEKENQNASFAN